MSASSEPLSASASLGSSSASAPSGVFITFEGGDGAGKTTHIRLLAKALEDRGYEVVCLREPGATALGEAIRNILLDVNNAQMSDECELLLYEAARAQIVAEVIRPALDRGAVVLCDRFYDSTVAYQGFGRGLSQEFITHCNDFACKGLKPHRTILMVTGGDAEEGLMRATKGGADRLELAGKDFHTRVSQGFRAIQEQDPDRIRLVVSDREKPVTSMRVFQQLEDLFPWLTQGQFAGEDILRVSAGKDASAAFGAQAASVACGDEPTHMTPVDGEA